MRKGNNKQRNTKIEKKTSSHRVIFPLYIPSQEGYYQDAFTIFKKALFSVRKTAISSIAVSVVSNGSSQEINDKLYQLYKKGYIDELIIETHCIGKINSLLKVLRTIQEPLVTISDADVLFLNGWEEAVLDVFEAFPKAGAVSPVPVFRKHFELTANIWFKYMFSNKLKFTPVKHPEAMAKFANSIGWPWLDQKYKDVYATLIAKNGTLAMVGCTHFVATYKSEVFQFLPKENSVYYQGGNSEKLYTDQPVVLAGGYRLSTTNNYAYHMGNIYEDWMEKIFKGLKPPGITINTHTPLHKLKAPLFSPLMVERMFNKLLTKKKFKHWLLKHKGLSKEQISNF